MEEREAKGAKRLRTAVIDIGSNSIRLVVYAGARRDPAVLFNEKVMAGLGAELASTGAIGDDALEVGREALARFRILCRQMDVDQTISFATAAVRDASNGDAFLKTTRKLGFDPRVLSGKEEAELAGMGVLSAIPDADGIVGDLGGGSLELARVAGGKVTDRHSFPLGVLRVADLRAKGKDKLKTSVRQMLKKTGWDKSAQGLPFYLVGGSWRSLARIDMHDSRYPLPVIHAYPMNADRAKRLVARLARIEKEQLKEVPHLSSSRIPTLDDAALMLSLIVRYLGSERMIASAYGVREGVLFASLSKVERARDPLLVATAESGALQARFPANSRLLNDWIGALFADDSDDMRRIRQAACNLGDVAWRANPNFRAERGLQIGLHGNWVGITGPEREMLGQALWTSFGGGATLFPGGGRLADDDATQRAIAWGLAMRLGQRLSGGTRGPLERTSIRRDGGKLVLCVPDDLLQIYGDPVAKRHRQLASGLGLEPVLESG